jgi:hypothetical protein
MSDAVTEDRLTVSKGGPSGPYLMLPVRRLDEVRAVLDKHRVTYWPDETAVALDGKNFITFLSFGRNGNAVAVQAILDAAQ